MTDASTMVPERLRRIRDCHFECYVDLAFAAERARTEGEDWFDVLDSELANIRSALEWGLATARPETAAFAASMVRYWRDRRLFIEGRQVLDRALRDPDLTPTDRVAALIAAGDLAEGHADRSAARDAFDAAHRLAVSVDDTPRRALAASRLGWMNYFLMLYRPAVEAFTEALGLSDALSIEEHALALRGLGWARSPSEGPGIALELHRQARELLEQAGSPALAAHYLVEVHLMVLARQLEEALAVAEKALVLARGGVGPLTLACEAKAEVAQALGDRELLRSILHEGTRVARAEGAVMWEANFQDRLARDAMEHGEVDLARDGFDEGLRLLDLERLSVDDAGARARLLVSRARLAQDDGELELAHELYRQAAALYSGFDARAHAEMLVGVSQLLADHGELEQALLVQSQALAVAELTETDTVSLRTDLAVLSDDLTGALGEVEQGLNAQLPEYQSPRIMGLFCRSRGILAEIGRLDEALAAADQTVAVGPAAARDLVGCRSLLDRARIRVELDDARGARSDLLELSAMVPVAWADDQLHLATTFSRLALLENRRDRAVELWTAVQEYRSANKRVPPRLSRRFEEPLRGLQPDLEPTALTSRAALDTLRALVAEEFEALRQQDGSSRP